MKASALAALILIGAAASPGFALSKLFYGGNGTVAVDSGLPGVGVLYGVDNVGDLRWYRYTGTGAADPSGRTGWDGKSGNRIGNGWQRMVRLLGGGDGVVLAIDRDGYLRWYRYLGQGADDRSAAREWDPNSGNRIGNGWGNFRHVVAIPRQGRMAASQGIQILAVERNGDLRWYSYLGTGQEDAGGTTGWHPNSGNVIGNGWQDFQRIVAAGPFLFAVKPNGDLHWYHYLGDGRTDRSAATGWAANSGNVIGNGWQTFRDIFGGTDDRAGFGTVLYAVDPNGDLRWYRYDGAGQNDPSGARGWHGNSGNIVGNGF